uniref:Uncharacterized protein n=1 Tax=Parascaris univalens TaxID=6257 RepID=A0A915B6T9_PARUN
MLASSPTDRLKKFQVLIRIINVYWCFWCLCELVLIALAAIKISQLLDSWDAAIDLCMTSKLSCGSMIEDLLEHIPVINDPYKQLAFL